MHDVTNGLQASLLINTKQIACRGLTEHAPYPSCPVSGVRLKRVSGTSMQNITI